MYEEQSIIPGLPDHLSSQRILSRISWWDYDSAVKVSKGWNSAVQEQNSIQSPTSSKESHYLGCIHPSPNLKKSPSKQSNEYSPLLFQISIRNSNSNMNSWETLPPIPGLSSGAPLSGRCVSVHNQVFVLGGRDPQSWEFISEVHVLDLNSKQRTWRKCAPMATARSAFACVASGSKIFVAGGQGEEVLTLASAEVYDIERDTWETLPDLNVPRTECNGALVGDRICIVGGYSSRESSSECWEDDDTFWVNSIDTIRIGDKSWETIDDPEKTSYYLNNVVEQFQVHSGILQSVHKSVLSDLLKKCKGDSWRVLDGKLCCSNDGTSLVFLVAGGGREGVYASVCSLDCESKVNVQLCRAVNGGLGASVIWERIDCPFELGRYGASCFLV